MVRCPKCALEYPPGTVKCAWCGAEFGEIAPKPEATPKPRKPEVVLKLRKPEATPKPRKPELPRRKVKDKDWGPYMGASPLRKKWLIVGAVIAVVFVAGFVFLLASGPSVGVGPGGTPIYAGAVENKEAENVIQQQMLSMGITDVEVGAYICADNSSNVISWYQASMVQCGWTEENELVDYSQPPAMLFYKKGATGSIVMAGATSDNNTRVVLLSCNLENAETLWTSLTYVYTEEPSSGLVEGNASAAVHDNDSSYYVENYKNENITITFYTTTGYLRYVGDPERGLTVTLGCPKWGWGPFVADVRGQTDYSKGAVSENGKWAVSATTGTYIRWRLYIPVTTAGRLDEGTYAYLSLGTDNSLTAVENDKVHPDAKMLWDDGDDLTFSVSCYGDSFTTSSGTVRLYGGLIAIY
jgi:hypothetical protein